MVENQITWLQPGYRVNEVLKIAVTKFKAAGVAQPVSDARILLGHSLNKPNERFYGRENDVIQSEHLDDFSKKILRRCKREPVSKIIGVKEFWSLELQVAPYVLDPRPDSETLIEAAVKQFPDKNRILKILDLGTGSGCLLLAAIKEWPHSYGIGIDIDYRCVELAKINARRNRLNNRVKFQTGNWASNLDEKFDIILCNPPYITANEIATLDEEVRLYEPKRALNGGPTGLDCYAELAPQFSNLLSAEGLIFLEVGFDQKKQILGIMRSNNLELVKIEKDLAQRDRCLILSDKHC